MCRLTPAVSTAHLLLSKRLQRIDMEVESLEKLEINFAMLEQACEEHQYSASFVIMAGLAKDA